MRVGLGKDRHRRGPNHAISVNDDFTRRRWGRIPDPESIYLHPSQLSNRAWEIPEAELALAVIRGAVLIYLGHKGTLTETLTSHRRDWPNAKALFYETREWLFAEDSGAALTLQTCCEMVEAAYGTDLVPEVLREELSRQFDKAFPDGEWRVRAFSSAPVNLRKALDDVAA
jgi:hypothetical protein